MEVPQISIEDAISGTEYMRDYLEIILNHLYPTYHCLKLIVKILLHGPDGSGKRMLARLAAKKLSINYCEEQVADLFDENIVGTEKKIKAAITKHVPSAPCLIYLTGYELFCNLEEPDLDRIEYVIGETLVELSETSTQPIIFVAATNNFECVYKTPLSNIFHYDLQLKSATFEQSKEILQTISVKADMKSDYLSELSQSANAGEYYLGNLLHILVKSQLKGYCEEEIEESQRINSVTTDTKGQTSTKWIDIGGLTHIKKEIIDAIQLSIEYPQLKKSGLKRTGMILLAST